MLRVHHLLHKKQSIASSRRPQRSSARGSAAMAAEQPKRGSPLGNDEHVQSSSKKPRATPALPTTVVKQERLEGGRRGDEELEAGEISQSNGVVAVVAMEVMDVPLPRRLILAMEHTLFHCRACLLPLKPPTFKCEAGHVVCGTCRASHSQACGGGATYAAGTDIDAFVGDAKLPCMFSEHGCESYVVYYEAGDHKRACPWAPCYCPDPGCDAFTSPARLLEHFRADHPSWPVTGVNYGKTWRIPLPTPQSLHVLVGENDRSVFLVTSSAIGLGLGKFVSVVCVRANGDAAAGVAQFRCALCAGGPSGIGSLASVAFMVASSNLSGGVAAAEQDDFLAVTPKMVRERDAPGEALHLTVRIDKADRAAATSTVPRFHPVSSSEILRHWYTARRNSVRPSPMAKYELAHSFK